MRRIADVVMVLLMFVVLGTGFVGYKIIKAANGAPQEIEGLILFLISAVALVGTGIIAGSASIWEANKSVEAVLTARLAPPTCEACGQFFEGTGAVVHTGEAAKRVCQTCAKALVEDSKKQTAGATT